MYRQPELSTPECHRAPISVLFSFLKFINDLPDTPLSHAEFFADDEVSHDHHELEDMSIVRLNRVQLSVKATEE